jgi:hypothetical protein
MTIPSHRRIQSGRTFSAPFEPVSAYAVFRFKRRWRHDFDSLACCAVSFVCGVAVGAIWIAAR